MGAWSAEGEDVDGVFFFFSAWRRGSNIVDSRRAAEGRDVCARERWEEKGPG